MRKIPSTIPTPVTSGIACMRPCSFARPLMGRNMVLIGWTLFSGRTRNTCLRSLRIGKRARGERLIRNPLKRAWLQHDLWFLFDWFASPNRGEEFRRERQELQRRIAIAIRRLALRRDEITSLPDNYAS